MWSLTKPGEMAHFPVICTTCLRQQFHEHSKEDKQKANSLFSQTGFCSDILQQDRNYFSRKKNSHLHTQTKETKAPQKWHFSSLENVFLSMRPAFHLCSQLQVSIENALVSLPPANHESFPIPAEMRINILSLWAWHSSTKTGPHIWI